MVGFHFGKLLLWDRRRFAHAHLHMHELAYDIGAQADQQTLEQGQGLALIFVQGVAVAVNSKAHILAQMLELDDVLAPIMIQRLKQIAFSR